MNIHRLDLNNSIISEYMIGIRDITLQKNRTLFKSHLKCIGRLMAYEISKTLSYSAKTVETPLGTFSGFELQQQPVLACILRAALPFYDGFSEVFTHTDTLFIAASRKYNNETTFDISQHYFAGPKLGSAPLILCDTMLASGLSIHDCINLIRQHGQTGPIHIACVLASEPGIAFLKTAFTSTPVDLWCGAVDHNLNAHAYIVPGLGDAGDLAFGEKYTI
jgi:uracil phosphoribosyltransferase